MSGDRRRQREGEGGARVTQLRDLDMIPCAGADIWPALGYQYTFTFEPSEPASRSLSSRSDLPSAEGGTPGDEPWHSNRNRCASIVCGI